MNKATGLSKAEMVDIEDNEKSIKCLLELIEQAKQFKLNDILICSRVDADTTRKEPITNSYGLEIKYKVLHVDINGIAYVKELGSNGVRGQLRSLVSQDDAYDPWGYSLHYEHDPHFIESIILSAEEGYDPTELQRKRKEFREQITKHNAIAKVQTKTLEDVIKVMASMKQGEMWWFSTKGGFTIANIRAYKNTADKTLAKYKNLIELDVVLTSGKNKTFNVRDLQYKNLYSMQPKAYKELSDSI